MTSTEARLAEKLGPFSEIFTDSHYLHKQNQKCQKFNLQLEATKMTEVIDRPLYKLVLMSSY